MSSSPVIAEIIKGKNIIKNFRELIGNTDLIKAENGTIRKLFGENLTKNSIHGFNSEENAAIEIAFFLQNMSC